MNTEKNCKETDIDNIIEIFNNINIKDNNEDLLLKNKAILIQKYVRRFLNNIKLSSKKDSMTFDIINQLLDNYINTYNLISSINDKLSSKKIRNQNFPSEISENIAKLSFFKKYKIMPSWDTKNGDLTVLNKKIEVKGFMSSGPSSFGPTENWDYIYFVDCLKFKDKIFTVYEIKLSNKNIIWKNIKINKDDTYEKQCLQERRPRISFDSLYIQLNKYCNIIFQDHIDKLY
jgi:hypothetical protein